MDDTRKKTHEVHANQLDSLPKVSVIVPVYNAEKYIRLLIESLLDLDYPKELLEIILIDNNSRDKTTEIIKRYSVMLLEEKTVQSSYAARNVGIQNANSEILAFTDADCIVTPQWIREGVKVLVSQSADLVGGRIEFIYSKQKTAAELYDSIFNLQNESNVRERNSATTANLFVQSHVFKTTGLFPDLVQSGGDIQWTSGATKRGFSLVYAPNAIVQHPTRQLKELLKKNFRVGTGLIDIYTKAKMSKLKVVFTIIKFCLPPRLSFIQKNVILKENKDIRRKLMKIRFVAYICNISKVFGILSSMSRKFKPGKTGC